jgi:hypothetical protein
VEAQLASGLSAPKFCQEKQIGYPSFMNWKRRLSGTVNSSAEKLPAFIELTPGPSMSVPASESGSQPLCIELDLGAGIQLRISRGA